MPTFSLSFTPIGFVFLVANINTGASFFLGSSFLIAIYSVLGFIFSILTFAYTMRLEYFNNMFKWGGIVGILGLIFSIIGVLYFLSYMTFMFNFGPLPIFLFVIINTIGVVSQFVASILLLIAFFELGDSSDSTMIKIGSILLVLIYLVGGIMIGLGLKQLSDEFTVIHLSGLGWDEIKKELRDDLEAGKTVFLKYFAVRKALNPLLLKIKVSEWNTTGEIEGIIHKNLIIPKKS